MSPPGPGERSENRNRKAARQAHTPCREHLALLAVRGNCARDNYIGQIG